MIGLGDDKDKGFFLPSQLGRHWSEKETFTMNIWYKKTKKKQKNIKIKKISHTMKTNNEKAIEVKNEPKINVDLD